MVVVVGGCCWLLMVVVGCWWLLVVVVGGCCWWLLVVVGGCWWLLVVVGGCWWLLLVVVVVVVVVVPPATSQEKTCFSRRDSGKCWILVDVRHLKRPGKNPNMWQICQNVQLFKVKACEVKILEIHTEFNNHSQSKRIAQIYEMEWPSCTRIANLILLPLLMKLV